ncbi:MAG: class II aldolase/adducin family protein [Desulfobacterales bacterium]|nr:class II aldolase/adducin family protein [Desulfobacterales bacterium]
MDALIRKYEEKLIQAGLADAKGPGRPIVGGLDYALSWNRTGPETKKLEPVFTAMAINSLVFFRPAAPYDKIIGFLAKQALAANRPIQPEDCETRTFLHDLPVVSGFSTPDIITALKHRKCVIISDTGADAGKRLPNIPEGPAIIAHGTVSPEQGFVVGSSVVFACFVKFFTDYLSHLRCGTASNEMHRIYDALHPWLTNSPLPAPDLMKGPFQTEESVYMAMIQAGAKTVEYGLVDSYFGNISFCRNQILYISQTGSSLNELAGCIDPVPLDGSSSAGLTASSELSAHLETISRTGADAILHGHPKFSVILSMDCDPKEKQACQFSTRCHIHCPKERHVQGIPIVPGEVGTGATGLCNTLPPAFERNEDAAIVYGHGLFTLGRNDFTQAFGTLLSVENRCRTHYMDCVNKLRR